MVALPPAKKNLKNQPTRDLKEGYWFNTDFIPPGWSDEDFLAVYAWRPAIESGNAEHNTFYGGQRMNTRGMENATKTRALDYILDWFKALAAYKLDRDDLTCKWLAVSRAREYHSYLMWSSEAEEVGTTLLFPFPESCGPLTGQLDRGDYCREKTNRKYKNG